MKIQYKNLHASAPLRLYLKTLCASVPLWLLFFLVFSVSTQAQPILGKEEAVKITLENNYGIKVLQNNVRIAKNNTSKFNTGYLPTVTGNVGTGFDLGGSSSKYNDGTKASTSGAFSNDASASVGVNYTLYNGQRRKLNVESLNESLDLSKLELKQTMEFSLIQLFAGYYNIARLTENVTALEQTLEVSKTRLLRAQYNFEYGQGTRLNVLNAEVDVNRDSINYRNTIQLLDNTKRDLNVILGRDVNILFEIDTTVNYSQGLELENLIQEALVNNVEMSITDKNMVLSNYDLQITETNKLPVISANGMYRWNLLNNDNKPILDLQNNYGFSAGVNLTWNIFDGGITRTRLENTQVQIQNQMILRDQLQEELRRDVTNSWNTYQNDLFILEAEEKNLETNILNFERTREQYNIGRVTSVEFRQAQLNLLNATISYNTAKYNAKFSELELLQLSGGLLDMAF